jgi:TRAP-type mannitol/chloroaromatic compound transport system permease small subunit
MKYLSYWFSVFGGAVILACALLVATDVILRNVFNISAIYSFEVTTYAYAIVISLAYADAVFTKKHIRIDVLYSRFPRPLKALVDVLALAGLTAFSCLLAYQGSLVALESLEIGASSKSTLAIPMFIPHGLWSLALIWFAVSTVYLLIRSAILLARWRTEEVHGLIGVDPHEGTDV